MTKRPQLRTVVLYVTVSALWIWFSDHALNALVEGVETSEQRELLIGLGCDHFQGFLFAAPMPRSELSEWLDTQTLPSTAALVCL